MSSWDVSGRLSLDRDFGKARKMIAVVEGVAQDGIRKVVRYACIGNGVVSHQRLAMCVGIRGRFRPRGKNQGDHQIQSVPCIL